MLLAARPLPQSMPQLVCKPSRAECAFPTLRSSHLSMCRPPPHFESLPLIPHKLLRHKADVSASFKMPSCSKPGNQSLQQLTSACRFLAGKAGMAERGGTPPEKVESTFDLLRDGIISYCYVGAPPFPACCQLAHKAHMACMRPCAHVYT